MGVNRLGRNDSCPCGSGKKYKRCCYPRTFPNFSRPNAGIPRPLDTRTAAEKRYVDMFRGSAPPPPSRREQPARTDRGFPYMMVVCAPLPPFGDGDALAGTVAPPTPEQHRSKYEAIRQANPHRATEVHLCYSHTEPFGHADVQLAMPADETVVLEDGRLVNVVDLWQGNRIVMEDGTIGTITQDRILLREFPDPPRPWKDGLWLGRVVGPIKHFGYEVIDFRWAGQTVTVTPNHPFWSASRRWWIPVGELRPGELVRVSGNVVAPVEAIGRRRPWNVELFNFEVEYFHNYFVGKDGNAVLVHNGPGYIKRPRVTDELERAGVSETTRQRAGVTRPPRHHIFPQAQREWFEHRGVDIDRYTLPLDEGTHQALHYGGGPGLGGGFWNKEVMTRLHDAETAAGRQLTNREVLMIGKQMRDQYTPGVKAIHYDAE